MTDTSTARTASPDSAGIVRYFHPEKSPALRRLNTGPSDVLPVTAALAQTDIETVRSLHDFFELEVRRAATEMLQDAAFAGQVGALPFRDGDVVVALGDSITDDALSWAHLLREVLAQARRAEQIQVVNHGITGHTTGEVISRIDTVLRDQPTWVIQLIGTNDARWHGLSVPVQTTSLRESERNLRAIRAVIGSAVDAQYVTMTPPPVVDTATDIWPPFRDQQIVWRDADVRALVAEIGRIDPTAVDVYATFTEHGLTDIMQADGVHPTEAGQRLILRTLVTHLTHRVN